MSLCSSAVSVHGDDKGWGPKVLMDGCLLGLNRRGLSLKPKCKLYVRSASVALTLELQMKTQMKQGAQILLFNYRPNNLSYSWNKNKCTTGLLYYFSLRTRYAFDTVQLLNISAVRKEMDEEGTGRGLISHTCKMFWLV